MSDGTFWITIAGTAATCAGAAGAWIAAVAAKKAAKATESGVWATNMTAIMDEYRSQVFADALRNVANLERKRGSDAIDYATRTAPDNLPRENENRIVHRHYQKCWQLNKSGLLPDDFFRDFVSSNHGYQLYYRLFLPIIKATTPLEDTRPNHFDWTDQMFKKFPPHPKQSVKSES